MADEDAIALCEERLADRARKEVQIRAGYEEQINTLRAQLGALEKAQDTELEDLDCVYEFAEGSLRLLTMVREIREKGRWVINGSAAVREWEKTVAAAEDPMRPVVDRVRAGLEGLVTVPGVVLRAQGSGEARGYKARESELTDFHDVDVMLPGEDWTDAECCFSAKDLVPIELSDELNFLFSENGVQEIDEYDMKECSVRGTSSASCDLLMGKRQNADET